MTALACALTGNLYAEDNDHHRRHKHGDLKHNIHTRQKAQIHRIKEVLKFGELTPKEARRLIHKEKKLNSLERRLKSDGTLTPTERARLLRRLNQLSKEIYKQKQEE